MLGLVQVAELLLWPGKGPGCTCDEANEQGPDSHFACICGVGTHFKASDVEEVSVYCDQYGMREDSEAPHGCWLSYWCGSSHRSVSRAGLEEKLAQYTQYHTLTLLSVLVDGQSGEAHDSGVCPRVLGEGARVRVRESARNYISCRQCTIPLLYKHSFHSRALPNKYNLCTLAHCCTTGLLSEFSVLDRAGSTVP
jgi:hypothetical protein